MLRSFTPTTDRARLTIVADECADFRPDVLTADDFQSPILTEMTREDVVVMIVENLKPESVGGTVGARDVDAIVKTEKAGGVDGPTTGISGGCGLKTTEGFGICAE